MTLTHGTIDHLRALQKMIGEGNRARGFREDEELLDKLTGIIEGAIRTSEEHVRPGDPVPSLVLSLGVVTDLLKVLRLAKIHSHANRLLLIVSEVVEAHDELRSGRAVDETWYAEGENVTIDGPFVHVNKPEGVPSELADTVIRAFDFADNAGIDLAAVIAEKDAYNATRPYRHGRKF